MTRPDDLVAWLRAQLDEDERVARAATPGPWHVAGRCSGEGAALADIHSAGNDAITSAYEQPCCLADDAEHIARHDPAQVLREVEAKRALLEEAIRPYLNNGLTTGAIAWQALRLLALPYGDRPGYREEWRP